jgi:hypothetical protein
MGRKSLPPIIRRTPTTVAIMDVSGITVSGPKYARTNCKASIWLTFLNVK